MCVGVRWGKRQVTSLLRRTQVNNAKTYYSIENAMRRVDEHEEMEHASLIVGDIHNLLDRLQQTFTTANGVTINVRGDFKSLPSCV